MDNSAAAVAAPFGTSVSSRNNSTAQVPRTAAASPELFL